MCIYFSVLFTIFFYKCHCVNMLCSPLAEEKKYLSNMYTCLHGYGMPRTRIGTPSAVLVRLYVFKNVYCFLTYVLQLQQLNSRQLVFLTLYFTNTRILINTNGFWYFDKWRKPSSKRVGSESKNGEQNM